MTDKEMQKWAEALANSEQKELTELRLEELKARLYGKSSPTDTYRRLLEMALELANKKREDDNASR